jgi:Lamin Tail Domain
MPRRTRRIITAALALAAVAGTGVAIASIPDENGVIHACRKIEGGGLRAVVSARRCRANERPLKWNVRGRRGPAGPAGPQGEQGPRGEPGPGLASFDALAGLPCTIGAATGAITIAYDETTGDAQIRCVLPSGAPAAVRINEFSTGVEGDLTDEFVELVNAGTEPADLSGYKLVYRSAAGTSDVALATLPDGTVLGPGSFFLFGGAGYAGARPADAGFASSLASPGGGVGLRTPDGQLVDSVGWGTATNALVEGTVAPAPPVAPAPGKSDGRHPDGRDTDDNAADFAVKEAPTPGAAN